MNLGDYGTPIEQEKGLDLFDELEGGWDSNENLFCLNNDKDMNIDYSMLKTPRDYLDTENSYIKTPRDIIENEKDAFLENSFSSINETNKNTPLQYEDMESEIMETERKIIFNSRKLNNQNNRYTESTIKSATSNMV